MKYDFTSILDRQGKDAIAVEGLGGGVSFAPDAPKEGFDVIPMWIAYSAAVGTILFDYARESIKMKTERKQKKLH